MRKCYLCDKRFEYAERVFQTELLYGRGNIKRDRKWKDVVLTVFFKNSKDEDVVLCRQCLAGALNRSAREVMKTSIPMTAGIQFMGF